MDINHSIGDAIFIPSQDQNRVVIPQDGERFTEDEILGMIGVTDIWYTFAGDENHLGYVLVSNPDGGLGVNEDAYEILEEAIGNCPELELIYGNALFCPEGMIPLSMIS